MQMDTCHIMTLIQRLIRGMFSRTVRCNTYMLNVHELKLHPRCIQRYLSNPYFIRKLRPISYFNKTKLEILIHDIHYMRVFEMSKDDTGGISCVTMCSIRTIALFDTLGLVGICHACIVFIIQWQQPTSFRLCRDKYWETPVLSSDRLFLALLSSLHDLSAIIKHCIIFPGMWFIHSRLFQKILYGNW